MNYINLNTHEIVDRTELDRRMMFEPVNDFKPFKEVVPEVSALQIAVKTGELVEDYDGFYFFTYDIIDKFEDVVEDGEVLSKSAQEQAYLELIGLTTPEPTNKPVPQVVEMRQARKVLIRAGLMTAVDNLVKSLDAESQVDWEYALTVERDHPIVKLAKTSLGLTDMQIDAMFIAAATL